MTISRHRFRKAGALALLPQAWGGEFDPIGSGSKDRPFEVDGSAAVVDIRGPLVHRPTDFWSLFCDSYGAIRSRVTAAFADVGTKAVVLRFDSPGGDVAGCFELARELRAMATSSGKPLVAFVEATCASAAYALACSASEIIVTKTGLVGSIGVINALASQAKLDQAMGIDIAVVASGTRKTDNNPHVPLTDDAVAALKGHVDDLAGVFFSLVEELRGIPAAALQALDGAIAYGDRAIAAGLADRVSTWSEVVAGFAGAKTETTTMKNAKATKYDEAIGALRAAADGEDEDAKKAKSALKAIDGGDDDSEKEKKDADGKKAEDEKKDAEAKAAKASEDEEKKDAEAKAMASNAVTMARELQELKAANAARAETEAKAKLDADRATLFAKRPDFSDAQRKTLASLTLADLKDAVDNWPRVNVAAGAAAAAMTPGGTRADDKRAPISHMHECTPEEQQILAKLNTTTPTGTRASMRGNALQMPAMMTQADAAARVKELEALQKGTG
jgi:ClpP class serine protease